MSADGWQQCPQCSEEAEKKINELTNSIDEQYGRLDPESWLEFKRCTELDIDEIERSEQTWREQFEFFGAESGVLKVSYSAYCTVCKLKLEFKQEHPFYPEYLPFEVVDSFE